MPIRMFLSTSLRATQKELPREETKALQMPLYDKCAGWKLPAGLLGSIAYQPLFPDHTYNLPHTVTSSISSLQLAFPEKVSIVLTL